MSLGCSTWTKKKFQWKVQSNLPVSEGAHIEADFSSGTVGTGQGEMALH